MKKLITSKLLLVAICFGFARQSDAQVIVQGSKVFDVYYGFGSLSSAFWKGIIENGSNGKVSTLGPVGARFEYMTSDKMGVGLEFNYTNIEANWNETRTDTISGSTIGPFNYQLGVTKIRVMPRFNIHFGQSEKFDGYFGVAAGYYFKKYYWSSNDPQYNGDDETEGGALIPMAIRFALGGRFMFTENIGMNMELGIFGGALVHGGLTFAF